MLSNAELGNAIRSATPGAREMWLWWLGQHGFVLKTAAATIYADAYLDPHPDRLVSPLLEAAAVTDADFVLGTHDHDDHIDRAAWPALAAASPAARFVVPALLLPRLADELGIARERFTGLDDGRTVDFGAVRISAVAAAHEFPDRDPDSGLHPYLGYIVEAAGCTVYHAGDTCLYEGLLAKLRQWRFDVVLLPINGRDAARLAAGCIGNMTYQEAVDLAGALRPGLAVPTHYDMFAGNTADPALFEDYMHVKYPDCEVRVCNYGEAVRVGAASACTGQGADGS